MSEMISVREAAKLMGITPQQVLNQIRRSQLPAQKIGWNWVINKKDLPKTKK